MCALKRIYMDTCHTNFVLSSPVRNLQVKSYVDLNECTWGHFPVKPKLGSYTSVIENLDLNL